MTRVRDSIGRKLRDHAQDPAKYAGTAAVQEEDKPAPTPDPNEKPSGTADGEKEEPK